MSSEHKSLFFWGHPVYEYIFHMYIYIRNFLGAAGGAASFGLTACHPGNAGDGNAGSCQEDPFHSFLCH